MDMCTAHRAHTHIHTQYNACSTHTWYNRWISTEVISMSLSLLNMRPEARASLSLIFSRCAASRKLLWFLTRAVYMYIHNVHVATTHTCTYVQKINEDNQLQKMSWCYLTDFSSKMSILINLTCSLLKLHICTYECTWRSTHTCIQCMLSAILMYMYI